jgi:hypothetical protein
MVSAEDKARLRFDLAKSNLQSIGRAQGVYVTALLAYVCLVWVLVFVGTTGQATIHLGLLDLNADGVWKITPFVILVLTLAYIGTVTANVPALAELREAERELFGSQHHSFFALHTHKNLIDYLAIRQLVPLILPIVFIGSVLTSYWAVLRLSALESTRRTAMIFGWSCLGIQVAYSVRPTWRFLRRSFGAERTHDVYN